VLLCSHVRCSGANDSDTWAPRTTSSSLTVGQVDARAVLICDFFDHGQAEASATRLGGDIGLERALQDVRRKAPTAVRHREATRRDDSLQRVLRRTGGTGSAPQRGPARWRPGRSAADCARPGAVAAHRPQSRGSAGPARPLQARWRFLPHINEAPPATSALRSSACSSAAGKRA
jgi:hypothetical protein